MIMLCKIKVELDCASFHALVIVKRAGWRVVGMESGALVPGN
jgi:hypothetical protein